MPERFETALRGQLLAWGIVPSDEQTRTLRAHFARVLDANRRFNLTRITEPHQAAIELYADSLSVIAWASGRGIRPQAVLDAGTGAGFPAVPVAVMQPRWRVTAVDGTGKKANFVADCARELGMGNLVALHKRVEHLHPPPSYDLILFKAVGKLDECLKWVQHTVARPGRVVLYKTPELPADEEHAGQRAASRLGYRELDRFEYTLQREKERVSRVLRIFGR